MLEILSAEITKKVLNQVMHEATKRLMASFEYRADSDLMFSNCVCSSSGNEFHVDFDIRNQASVRTEICKLYVGLANRDIYGNLGSARERAIAKPLDGGALLNPAESKTYRAVFEMHKVSRNKMIGIFACEMRNAWNRNCEKRCCRQSDQILDRGLVR